MSADRPTLRPYLPADAPRCAAIFRDSIEALAGDDYDDDQRRAWAAGADDVAAFGARLAKELTLIAAIAGELAGFAALRGADEIDLLYVDPAYARRGIGAALIDALTRLAAARGATRVTSEASDAARASFERQGFVAQQRNMVMRNGQWLANTTMIKRLSPDESAAPLPSSPH